MKKVLFLLSILSVYAQAATFSLDVADIKVATQEPFYKSTLPAEIYQFTQDNNLIDLHVMNAKSELVPHAFIRYPANSTLKIEPLNPIKITEDALKNSATLRLNIEKSGQTSNILIEDHKQNIQATQQIFIVALKEKRDLIQQLKFNWEGAENKFINVEIATGNDLQSWRKSNTGNLLKTMQSANSILKDRIAFSDTGEKYLKITISQFAGFLLTGINAEMDENVAIKPAELESSLTFLNRTEDSNTLQTNIDFEATGRYPAEALSIKLPQANTVVSLTILTRNNTGDAWQPLSTGNAYQFNQSGQILNSPDITFSAITARYWRLQFNAAGGGVGSENPEVALKFSPPIIVWNARGNAPFVLKVGEDDAKSKPSSFALSSLMPEANADKIKALPNATLSLVKSDKNVPIWQMSESETSHKPLYLWAGLGLGVLLLFGMAFSLLRKPN